MCYTSQTTSIGVSHSVYGIALLVGFSSDNNVRNACVRRSIVNNDLLNLRL